MVCFFDPVCYTHAKKIIAQFGGKHDDIRMQMVYFYIYISMFYQAYFDLLNKEQLVESLKDISEL